jgi:hypothetical protein
VSTRLTDAEMDLLRMNCDATGPMRALLDEVRDHRKYRAVEGSYLRMHPEQMSTVERIVALVEQYPEVTVRKSDDKGVCWAVWVGQGDEVKDVAYAESFGEAVEELAKTALKPKAKVILPALQDGDLFTMGGLEWTVDAVYTNPAALTTTRIDYRSTPLGSYKYQNVFTESLITRGATNFRRPTTTTGHKPLMPPLQVGDVFSMHGEDWTVDAVGLCKDIIDIQYSTVSGKNSFKGHYKNASMFLDTLLDQATNFRRPTKVTTYEPVPMVPAK